MENVRKIRSKTLINLGLFSKTQECKYSLHSFCTFCFFAFSSFVVASWHFVILRVHKSDGQTDFGFYQRFYQSIRQLRVSKSVQISESQLSSVRIRENITNNLHL